MSLDKTDLRCILAGLLMVSDTLDRANAHTIGMTQRRLSPKELVDLADKVLSEALERAKEDE